VIRSDSLSELWPKVRLGDVVEFLDHKRKPITAKDRVAGPYPYYGANSQQDSVEDYIFDEPLILLAEDGGNFGDPDRTIAYQVEGKCWVNNHAHVLRPTLKIDIRYLCRQLEKYDVRSHINGATREKLNKGAAQEIVISLPTLEEQKHIAAILDKADAIRRKRQQAIDLTNYLLRSVFLDMFGDPVKNSKGFKVGKIGDLLESVNYGTSAKAGSEGKYPILRMNNITYEGAWNLDSLKYIDMDKKELKKYTAEPGDILFNRTNSKELVGKTAVFRENTSYVFAGYLVRSKVNSLATPEYISGYLNSSHGKMTLQSMCKSIVGMANINAKEYQAINILIPPVEEQRKYSSIVESCRNKISSYQSMLEKTNELFSVLSQRAFCGDLNKQTKAA